MRRIGHIVVLVLLLPQLAWAQLWPRVIVEETPAVRYATRLGGKLTGGTEVLEEGFESYATIHNKTNRTNGIVWNWSINNRFVNTPWIDSGNVLRADAGNGIVSTNLIPGLVSVSFKLQSTDGINNPVSCSFVRNGGAKTTETIVPSTILQDVSFSLGDGSGKPCKLEITATGTGYNLLDDFQFTVLAREYLYIEISTDSTFARTSASLSYAGLTADEKKGTTTYGDISQTPPYYQTLPAGPERVGYSFVGWQVSLTSGGDLYRKDGTKASLTDLLYPAGTDFLVSQSVTLTAVYTKCDHCFQVRF